MIKLKELSIQQTMIDKCTDKCSGIQNVFSQSSMEKTSQIVSQKATEALLFEVSASPKPGLVDRFNSGAHQDMDFFTFMSSSASLTHYFYQCSYYTMEYLNSTSLEEDNFYPDLFKHLRILGIEAEQSMFKATCGINTHKGLIFSLGLMVSGTILSGYRKSNTTSPDVRITQAISPTTICKEVQLLVQDICKQDFIGVKNKQTLTAGERLFLEYGVKGIRGEAEVGYRSVLECGLPCLNEALRQGSSFNDALVQVLLHLMVETIDTNILSRHNWVVLKDVQKKAKTLIDLGGMNSSDGLMEIIKTNQDFILKNISPGGSADLLAVTIYLYLIQK